ncbi:hypothetical protein GCM10027275_24440 [Rhabdobacter roseus]|uniref:Uncharacterized protein n=1 Tax=Rhabdobacter roseus TaxID=1655419 RepID=A0A840TLV3_9BACT|nr:hypothetical protein [Rhabdobacter roseus]MBB5284384.1 hypothetical protein [Rhabdobacter roseus]
MKKQLVIPCLVASSLLFWNCGGKSQAEEEKEEPKNAFEAIQKMAEKAEDMQKNGPVEPVDFRKLKEFLPTEAGGLPRTEASGEKNGAMGFSLSQAEGKYSDANGESTIDIDLLDTGGIGGMAMMGMAAWALAEVDKETARGYEKTTKIDGHKAFEKYNTEDKSGELNVLVGDRFIVNVKGYNVTMDQLKGSLSDIDLKKLKGLE